MADAPHDAGWIGAAFAAAGAVSGGFFVWLGQRMLGRAAVQTALNEQFKTFTEALQTELRDERRASAEERETWRQERATYRELIERREVAWARHCSLLQGQIAALAKGDAVEAERLRVEASMSALVILPPLPDEK